MALHSNAKTAVKKLKLMKNLLNGRIPTKEFPNSNGHKRLNVSTMQMLTMPGNILLTCDDTYAAKESRNKLLAAAKESGLEYAYIVKALKYTLPPVVYRIYVADGREEIVRGAKLSDLTARSFNRVIGASDKEIVTHLLTLGTFVAYITPESLLFDEMEITKDNNLNFNQQTFSPQP